MVWEIYTYYELYVQNINMKILDGFIQDNELKIKEIEEINNKLKLLKVEQSWLKKEEKSDNSYTYIDKNGRYYNYEKVDKNYNPDDDFKSFLYPSILSPFKSFKLDLKKIKSIRRNNYLYSQTGIQGKIQINEIKKGKYLVYKFGISNNILIPIKWMTKLSIKYNTTTLLLYTNNNGTSSYDMFKKGKHENITKEKICDMILTKI